MCFDQLVCHRPDLVEVEFRRRVWIQHSGVIDVVTVLGHQGFYGHFLHGNIGPHQADKLLGKMSNGCWLDAVPVNQTWEFDRAALGKV